MIVCSQPVVAPRTNPRRSLQQLVQELQTSAADAEAALVAARMAAAVVSRAASDVEWTQRLLRVREGYEGTIHSLEEQVRMWVSAHGLRTPNLRMLTSC